MTPKNRLLCGPLAAIVFWSGVIPLPIMMSSYSQVHQTVSEIGEVGSPARVPFSLMLGFVSVCIVIFASALRQVSLAEGHATLAAYITGCMAVSAMGVGISAYPSPLHNYFGLSEMIGYQAPLALALSWRGDPTARHLVGISSVASVLMWCSIALILGVGTRYWGSSLGL